MRIAYESNPQRRIHLVPGINEETRTMLTFSNNLRILCFILPQLMFGSLWLFGFTRIPAEPKNPLFLISHSDAFSICVPDIVTKHRGMTISMEGELINK